MGAVASSKGVPTALGGGVGGGQAPAKKATDNIEKAIGNTERTGEVDESSIKGT